MRKLLIVAGILVALAAVVIAAVFFFVDVNQFRPTIQAQMEKHLHRSVTLGAMSLKLIPPSIQINDVSISEAPEFGSQAPFLAARQMYVRVSLPALIRREIQVDSLRIVQPRVALIRGKDGQWNYQTLSTGTSSGGSGSAPAIGELLIEDGTVAVTDRAAAGSTSQYDHIDITLRNFAPGRHFDLESKIHLPGAGKEQIALVANGSGMTDVTGTLSLQTVSLAGVRAFLGAGASELSDVVLSGDSKFKSEGNAITGDGSVTINDARIKEPGHVDFSFRDDRQSGLVQLPSVQVKLGGLTVNGKLQTNSNAAPPTIDAELNTENAPLAEFLRVARMLGAAEGLEGSGTVTLHVRLQGNTRAPVYSGSGALRNASLTLPALGKPLQLQTADLQFSEDSVKLQNLTAGIGGSHLRGSASIRDFTKPEVQFTGDVDAINVAEAETWVTPEGSQKPGKHGAARPLNGSGTLNVGTITYNNLVLTDVKAVCKFDNGVIRLAPLTARLFGGTEAGDITVDTRPAQPNYAVQAKFAGVDANKLLSATSALKILSGTLASDADIHLNPVPGQEMARGLNGDLRINISNGRLTGVSIMNEISKVGKFLGATTASGDNFTKISKLGGSLNIHDGVANTKDLQMDFDGGSMTGAGTIGLADQTLNLKVTTVLAKETSRLAGGNQIGGFLTTALANSKGELVIPAIVKGTFAKPQFEPDAGEMAKLKLGGLLPTKDNPAAYVSGVAGIIGAFTGKKQPADGASNNPAAKGVLDVLDAFRKKK